MRKYKYKSANMVKTIAIAMLRVRILSLFLAVAFVVLYLYFTIFSIYATAQKEDLVIKINKHKTELATLESEMSNVLSSINPQDAQKYGLHKISKKEFANRNRTLGRAD